MTIKCNLRIVDYLDITLNLNNSHYRPCTKPNNEINYTNKESHYSYSIIKQLPLSAEKCFSKLSVNEKSLKNRSNLTLSTTVNKVRFITINKMKQKVIRQERKKEKKLGLISRTVKMYREKLGYIFLIYSTNTFHFKFSQNN